MASGRGGLGRTLMTMEASVNSFSYTIDIKRFQNLLETSVDDTERQKIKSLLTEEKAKAELQAAESKEE